MQHQTLPVVSLHEDGLGPTINELETSGIARFPVPFAGPNGSPITSMSECNPSLISMYDPELKEKRLISLVRGFGRDNSSDYTGRREGISRLFKAKFRENGHSIDTISTTHVVGNPENIDLDDLLVQRKVLDIEDPRTVCIDGKFIISHNKTFMDRNNKGDIIIRYGPGHMLTTDFYNFLNLPLEGIPEGIKDLVDGPEKTPKGYVKFYTDRIFDEQKGRKELMKYKKNKQGIYICYSHDFIHWHSHEYLLPPDKDEVKLGPGTVIKWYNNWLMLYHAVKHTKDDNGNEIRNYYMRMLLLDSKNPSRILGISGAVLVPERKYEINEEWYLRHVFPTGAERCSIVNGKAISGVTFVYGAGDRYSMQGLMSDEFIRQNTLAKLN